MVYSKTDFTLEEIIEYMDCSLCHHLKYIKKIPPSASHLADNKNKAYKEALTEAMSHYFIKHQQQSPLTLKQLYDKFYSLWLDKTNTRESGSILTRRIEDSGRHAREERSKYITKGYETLRGFYNTNANMKQAVLAVNHPYTIPLNGITVEGHFDLVREVMDEKANKRRIQLVSFQLSNRKPDKQALQKDIKLSAMAFGFYQTFDVSPDDFIVEFVHKNEAVDIFKTDNDYKRLFTVLEAFKESVNVIKPYPRPGAHLVISEYKELCDNYQF